MLCYKCRLNFNDIVQPTGNYLIRLLLLLPFCFPHPLLFSCFFAHPRGVWVMGRERGGERIDQMGYRLYFSPLIMVLVGSEVRKRLDIMAKISLLDFNYSGNSLTSETKNNWEHGWDKFIYLTELLQKGSITSVI